MFVKFCFAKNGPSVVRGCHQPNVPTRPNASRIETSDLTQPTMFFRTIERTGLTVQI